MKKIAFLRPAQTLSQYEMDYVRLLEDEFELQVFTVGESAIGSENVSAVRLKWPDQFMWNGRERSFMNAFYARVFRRRYHLPGLEKVLKGFDIVQAGEARSEYSYQAALLKPHFGYKLFLSASENQPIFEDCNNSMRRRIELVLERTDHAFCIPMEAQERLISAGLASDKITVIGHGIDCDRFCPAGKKVERDFRVGYCGRFRKEKGLSNLIRAAKESDTELLLLGEGPEEDELRKIAGEKVRFLPARLYHEIHTFYHDIDLFVLPSIPVPGLVEQFGFVLMEAMASGIPVAASRIGGIPNVLGDVGIFVEPGNVEELKNAIIKIRDDADLRKELGIRGRARALQLFRREAVVNKMRERYRKVL